MLPIFLQHPVSLTPTTNVQRDMEHFGNVDMVYAFDAVNGDECKSHVANIWNKEESKNCKIIVTNSHYDEMTSLGFQKIVENPKVVNLKFSRVLNGSESRLAYIYKRTDYRKDRAKYMFELLPTMNVEEFSKPFKELFAGFKEGEVADTRTTLGNGYPVNYALLKRNCDSLNPLDMEGMNHEMKLGRKAREHVKTYNMTRLQDEQQGITKKKRKGKKETKPVTPVKTSNESTQIVEVDLTDDSDDSVDEQKGQQKDKVVTPMKKSNYGVQVIEVDLTMDFNDSEDEYAG